MRRLGCLLFLAILVGGLFIGDLAVTRAAEQRTAQRVTRALEADSTVDFQGWPVTVRALLGSIPTAQLKAQDVPLDNGASIDQLDVVLRDVEVNVADLRGGGERPRNLPAARRGRFEAEISERSVIQMLGVPGNVVDVRLADGVIVMTAAGVEVEAEAEARDGDVVVSLSGPLANLLGAANFPIDLSEQPGAPAVDEVEIRDGVMLLRGELEDVRR
jgi:hypothetical protein